MVCLDGVSRGGALTGPYPMGLGRHPSESVDPGQCECRTGISAPPSPPPASRWRPSQPSTLSSSAPMRSDMWWIELRSLPTPHLALRHTHSRPWLLLPFAPLSQSPLKEAPPPRVLDGGAVLDKYMTTGAGAGQMSGAEYYALVGHIKRQHGPKGEVCAPCTSLCGTATRPCHWPPLLLSPNPTPFPLAGSATLTPTLSHFARVLTPPRLSRRS